MRIVFDIGATKTRIAEVTAAVGIKNVVRYDTDVSVDGIATFIQQLKAYVGSSKVTALVGDAAGEFDAAGTFVSGRNLSAWIGKPMIASLEDEFKCHARLYNDVVLCGVGEAHNGSGIISGEMAYMTISTGVNAVRILDGYADEQVGKYHVGRQIIAGGPGRATSLEDLIGGAALQHRTGQPPAKIKDPQFWQQTAVYVARGVFNLRLFWNPSVIVLGGSMMHDIELAEVEAAMKLIPGSFTHDVEFRLAALDDTAGLQGAVIYLEK